MFFVIFCVYYACIVAFLSHKGVKISLPSLAYDNSYVKYIDKGQGHIKSSRTTMFWEYLIRESRELHEA